MHKVLLVEDEKILREAYTILLEAQDNLELTIATNGQEALERCANEQFDIILLDLMMPVVDGVGFLEKANLQKTSPHTKVVVLSNLSSGEDLMKALNLGAHRHAVKSDLAPNDVIAMIEEVLEEQ